MSPSTPDSQTDAAATVPRHIAIIMDGNNRWAKRRGLPGPAGHRAGVEAVRSTLKACREEGVEVLTLFAFSSENWGRPRSEVRTLLALFSRYLRNEVRQLHVDGVRLRFVGQRHRFGHRLQRLMAHAENLTQHNRGALLVIAMDYGGRWDITQAARALAERVQRGDLDPAAINEDLLAGSLSAADLPPPDLCIRTGGETRVSNFQLWQLAYSELYFTPLLWPDFDGNELRRAIRDFAGRERRFGRRNIAAEPLSVRAPAESPLEFVLPVAAQPGRA